LLCSSIYQLLIDIVIFWESNDINSGVIDV
jgi:hypothetical protein